MWEVKALAGAVELGVGLPFWMLSKVYRAFGAGKELSKAEIEVLVVLLIEK